MQFELVSSSDIAQQYWEVDGVLTVMPFNKAAQAQRAAQLMAQRAATDGLILGIHDDKNEGFVHLINKAFQYSNSHWFCYVAQDAFAGRNWLALAINALKKNHGKLLPFNDGKWHGQLAAFGLVERQWAAQQYNGSLFFSGYQQHYADAELTLLALQEQCLVYKPESMLIEIDWEKENTPINSKDRALFLQRANTKFDGKITSHHLLNRFS